MKSIVLVGKQNSGKTTTLRFLIYYLCFSNKYELIEWKCKNECVAVFERINDGLIILIVTPGDSLRDLMNYIEKVATIKGNYIIEKTADKEVDVLICASRTEHGRIYNFLKPKSSSVEEIASIFVNTNTNAQKQSDVNLVKKIEKMI